MKKVKLLLRPLAVLSIVTFTTLIATVLFVQAQSTEESGHLFLPLMLQSSIINEVDNNEADNNANAGPTSEPTDTSKASTVKSTTIVAHNLKTQSGKIGNNQTLANIQTQDQTGSADEWGKFVKFLFTNEPYRGHRSYTLPANIAPESITSIQIEANYRGPGIERQKWTWRLYNWSTQSWVTVGDNGSVPWWGDWNMLYFNAAGTLSDFVDPNSRAIRVEIEANNVVDSIDLDYEALTIDYQVSNGSDSIVRYAEDASNFLNPERGFHENINIMDISDSELNLRWMRGAGYTLNASSIGLGEFREQPISAEFLAKLEARLNEARDSGIKLVLRASYNNPGQTDDYQAAVDAPRDRILQHIKQLAPIFNTHSDVVAVYEAGFIGAWGEWHSSSNGLAENQPAREEILSAMLDAVPQERNVLMRNIPHLMGAYPMALSETYAYSGSKWARTGHHNDCFLSNEIDTGTYRPLEKKEQYQSYLDSLTPWVAMGGETCHETPAQHRSDCQTTLAEMERFHWSYIADKYYEPDLTRWKNEGCFEEISKRLGYRFRLLQSTPPDATAMGSTMRFSLRMTNDGFANIYNPRDIVLVMRNQGTADVVKIKLEQQDARRWLPQPGVTKSLDIAANLPASMQRGTYDLYLALPDPKLTLANNPAYSIRLANQLNGRSIWESSTGYNALGITVEVTGQNSGPTATPVPPKLTNTPPPTSTATPVPAMPTNTPTPTSTSTPVPPTPTNTPQPTSTSTPVPAEPTNTPTNAPTSTPTQGENGQTLTHIEVADSMWTQAGELGNGQSWANMHIRDQGGSVDEWSKFIKFLPTAETPYYGFRTYILPDTIAPESITAIQVQANYRGPAIQRQEWRWRLFNWSTQSWVTVGDNRDAPWWGDWTMLYFDVAEFGSVRDFVNPSTHEVRLDMQANNAVDSMDLDYEALVVHYSASN